MCFMKISMAKKNSISSITITLHVFGITNQLLTNHLPWIDGMNSEKSSPLIRSSLKRCQGEQEKRNSIALSNHMLFSIDYFNTLPFLEDKILTVLILIFLWSPNHQWCHQTSKCQHQPERAKLASENKIIYRKSKFGLLQL